jgi:glutaminase
MQALRTTGLRKNDPRLQELTDNLRKEHIKCGGHEGISHETQKLNREQFKR